MKHKILSVFLAVLLSFAALPFGAAAEEITVDMPIELSFENATGIDINIRLDPALVQTARVTGFNSALGEATYAENQNGAKLKVGIASAKGMTFSGTAFYLRLTLKAPAGSEDELFKLLQVKINETTTFKADNCIILAGVKNSGIYNRNVTPAFNEGTATLDGKEFLSGSTVSEEGEHTLLITDLNGKVRQVDFVIDKTCPEITVLPYNTQLQKAPLTVYATVSGGRLNADSYTFNQNGNFTFIATDDAGNKAEKTVTLTNLYTDFTFELLNLPQDISVVQNLPIDYSGWVIKVFYNNGEVREYSVLKDNISYSTQTAGQMIGTVAFEGKTVNFDYTVIAKTLVSISVLTPPKKTEYKLGDTFDSTGMSLNFYYNDNSVYTVTEGWQADYSFDTVGETTVTITYGECNATLSVSVTYLAGDVNDDGTVDLNDVVALAQVVAGWSGVAHNEAALDVDGSGVVDLNDVVLLAQFVAGWDVTIN